ncbi:HAD hydrolase family protein [Streptomyces sp. NPDC002588]|uniref:HAD family hydrolase n=1 Tax=Streptomyces sp. NPDC002588 TaxID=3154419 RepID=UPI00331E476C
MPLGTNGTRPPGSGDAAIRFAAFDLDGTLLDADGCFRPNIAERLSGLRRRGLVPLVVSGRSVTSFLRVDPGGGTLAALEDHVLLGDGNVLLRRGTGEITVLRRLPDAALTRLLDHGVTDLVAEIDGTQLAWSRRARLRYAHAYDVPRSCLGLHSSRTVPSGALTGIAIFEPLATPTEILAGLPHEWDRISSFDALLIRPHGTCKATGLADYLTRYRAPAGLQEVVSFGDAYNDGCLLGSSGIGIAVSNADSIAARYSDLQLREPVEDFLASFDPVAAAAVPRVRARTERARTPSAPCFGGHVRLPPARQG